MTRPLRRSHLGIWLVLAALLPFLLIVALAVRRSPTPVNPSLNWSRVK